MSTPFTATMPVPPNHQYYQRNPQYLPPIHDYSQPPYHPNANLAPTSNTNARPSRAEQTQYQPSYTTNRPTPINPPQMLRPMSLLSPAMPPHGHSQEPPTPLTPRTMQRKRSVGGPVDWDKYFRGTRGTLPTEIIVIDEDDDKDRQCNGPPSHSTNQAIPANGQQAMHSDKRQKMASASTYNPVYQNSNPGLTQPNSPYPQSPSMQTTYTSRTESCNNTTAPTSLGSTASGTNDLYEPAAGQKRKRPVRQPDFKKSQDLRIRDPYAEYHPPPYPPFKAQDVYVHVVHDTLPRRNVPLDDKEGHYEITEGSDLTPRYCDVSLLGQGTFGRVVKAFDRQRQKHVAIKIIRAVQKYRDASRIELRVLSTLASNDRQNRNKCIHLRDAFDYRNHICIVTDLLGQSVFDFLKNNSFVPFPSSHIQQFARQLFTSVAFLHDLNLIHTDLKPENILLVDSQYQTFTYNRPVPSSSALTNRTAKFRKVLLEPEIRLIDFGSATFDDEYHSTVVSTRHYRAPEIYLNIGWSYPCDIWSIGCILVEFYTGDALFQTHDDLEHLAMMEAVCGGPIDKNLIRQVTSNKKKNEATKYFRRQVLDYPNPETEKGSRKFVKAVKHLEEYIPAHVSTFNRLFLDLLKRIFVYDPKKRITAKQALQHPWFREMFEDDGTAAMQIKARRQQQAEEEQRADAQRQRQP